MRRSAVPLCVTVWLLFTGIPPARAEPPQLSRTGPVLRFGSAVGFSEIRDQSVPTLGGQVALGYRLGPLVLGAEYERLALLKYIEDLGGNISLGGLRRMGVSGRLVVLHIGRGEVDPPILLYVEGGAGRQSGRWSTGREFSRNDVSAGTGVLLGGQPFHSVGWQLGWRMTAARADGESVFLAQSCKGKSCAPPPAPRTGVDLGLVVTCAMTAAW